MEAEEDSLEMNWNIAEMLPEEGKCREKLEGFLTLYIEQLANGTDASKALKTLSHQAYEIVLALHQSAGRNQDGPAIEFIKALCKILTVDPTVAEAMDSLRKNMLQLVGLGEFSEKAIWKDTSKSYILNEMICQACNLCRDVDLLRDKHRAMKDGAPVWLCSQCFVNYDTDEIEKRLIESINRKLMSYTLQDVQCIRCQQIKQDNILEYCPCAGKYKTLIQPEDVQALVKTFNAVADDYSMVLLKDHTDLLMNNI